MRDVATFASFHADRRMLKGKRPTLVDMTLETRLLVLMGLRNQRGPGRGAPCGSKASMRIVAVAALHEALVDTMLERHGKGRSHFGVAAVTKLRLRFCKKSNGGRELMNGMAIGATDTVVGMRGNMNVCTVHVVGVAS